MVQSLGDRTLTINLLLLLEKPIYYEVNETLLCFGVNAIKPFILWENIAKK